MHFIIIFYLSTWYFKVQTIVIRVPYHSDPIQLISGGIILAPEGINGSICGTRESVEKVLAFIQSDNRLKGLRQVESPVSPEEEAIHHGHSSSSPLAAGEDVPFRWDHVRVKLKKEVNCSQCLENENLIKYRFIKSLTVLTWCWQIVTLGMPAVSPTERVGKYVSPRDWNALISDPNIVSILLCIILNFLVFGRLLRRLKSCMNLLYQICLLFLNCLNY